MDKRYQVFVSSTYKDLVEERSEVVQALLELDGIPSGMELFPAADEEQIAFIRKVIEECDYYVLIIAGRYGSVGPNGLSYTEMEYDYASEKGKYIMAFLHEEPGKLPMDKCEDTDEGREKLAKFRKKVGTGRLVRYWSSKEDLAGKLARSFAHAVKIHPKEGWVRARFATRIENMEELEELRTQVRSLKGQLQRATLEAPETAEGLAKGTDTTTLAFKMVFQTKGNPAHGVSAKNWTRDVTVDLSWDTIFSRLGPSLYTTTSEDSLDAILSGLVRDAVEMDDNERTHYWRAELRSTDAKRMIVQLMALGLIEQFVDSDALHRRDMRLMLTSYGKAYLTSLLAERKASGTT